MPTIAVHNLTRPLPSPLNAAYCQSFFCQLRGLTFRRSLPSNWGLLLVQKREGRIEAAIHMFMMWIDLAVIWINQDHQVVDARPAYRWRSILIPQAPAKYVLELHLSRLDEFQPGDKIQLERLPPH